MQGDSFFTIASLDDGRLSSIVLFCHYCIICGFDLCFFFFSGLAVLFKVITFLSLYRDNIWSWRLEILWVRGQCPSRRSIRMLKVSLSQSFPLPLLSVSLSLSSHTRLITQNTHPHIPFQHFVWFKYSCVNSNMTTSCNVCLNHTDYLFFNFIICLIFSSLLCCFPKQFFSFVDGWLLQYLLRVTAFPHLDTILYNLYTVKFQSITLFPWILNFKLFPIAPHLHYRHIVFNNFTIFYIYISLHK